MQKRLFTFALLILVGVIWPGTLLASEKAVYRPGDVDGDLDVDMVDLALFVGNLCGPAGGEKVSEGKRCQDDFCRRGKGVRMIFAEL